MRIRILFALLLLSGADKLSAQKQGTIKRYTIIPIEKSVQVDGLQDRDFKLIRECIHDERPFLKALLKYEDHLYVILIVYDQKMQNQIMLTGLQLEFAVRGKSGFKKTIRYPQGIPSKDRPTDPEMLEAFEKAIQIKKEEIPAKMDQMELIGFYGKNDTIWGKNMNEGGIHAAFGFDQQGAMIYEMDIPCSTIFGDDCEIDHFKLTIETGKLGRPRLDQIEGVGISGTSLSNPARIETRSQRESERKMEKYRSYTVPEKLEIKKVFGLTIKKMD
jgi:hypothetical protein